MKKMLTIEDLHEVYSISRATIDRWRKEGMPFVKVGRGVRFVEEDVTKWIKENKQNYI